jgi:cystathionine beta-lyase
MKDRRWQDKSAYTYGLHGTPSTFVLEEKLATLEGGTYCSLMPSGLSAIAHVNLAFLQAGDHVLLPDNAYSPNISMLKHLLSNFGITSTRYDPMSLSDFSAKLNEGTRLVWLEAAGSVTMEFPDLVGLCKATQAHNVRHAPSGRRPSLLALDNTWGAGLAFNAFELGVDMTVHALTKYPSGGGDVLMGSVVSKEPAIAQALSQAHMHLGTGVGPHDVDAILKGLQSMVLRYEAQDRAARFLAHALMRESAFAEILHPALPHALGHAHWRALCVTSQRPEGLAAGIFSVVFKSEYSQERVEAFCDRLKLFQIGYSWGGPMSLVVPYDIGSMRACSQAPWCDQHVVRLCIGLEDPQDLLDDLRQALKVL